MNNEYNLTTGIIALSDSSTWLTAKDEWSYDHGFQREGSECLCGKKNIKNVCVIINNVNQCTVEVGNCCVEKFLKITDGRLLFQTLLKLKKNIKAHIPSLLLNTFNLDVDDIILYKKFYDREKKSAKEWLRKIEINELFLDYYIKDSLIPLPDQLS